MNSWYALVAGLLAFFMGANAVNADQHSENKGYQIMKGVFESYDGFIDATADLEMILYDRSGVRKKRRMKLFALEQSNDGDRTVLLFKSPRDVDGTALLTHSHFDGINDQWIYLPAFRRNKRISDNAKTSYFMGSEFTYEDLSGMELPMYSYRYLEDQTIDNIICHVIELRPQYPNTGYSRMKVYVNGLERRIRKIDFFDKEDRQCKTLEATGYRKYIGKFWHPSKLSMVNHITEKRTDFLIGNINYKTKLKKHLFTPNTVRALK